MEENNIMEEDNIMEVSEEEILKQSEMEGQEVEIIEEEEE